MTFRTILATGGLITLLLVKNADCQSDIFGLEKQIYVYVIDTPKKDMGSIYMAELTGAEIKGLASDYFGFKGKLPDSLNIDFKANIEAMWQRKLKRAKKNDDVKNFYEEHVKKYDSKTSKKMTLDEYLTEASDSIDVIKRVIDWDAVMTLKNDEWKRNKEKKYLDSTGFVLVKEMASSLTNYTVMGNFMTEILSGDNGYQNALMIDFLLQSAGREFIDYIPANDKFDSKGPSQFTPNAWFDDGTTILKASLINYALPEVHRIPKSVNGLTGVDHVKATYLLNINNLCELVGSLNQKQLKILKDNWTGDNIAEFAALAHRHDPNAVKAGLRWIDKKMKKDIHEYFTVKNSNHYFDYGSRFKSNLNGVRNYHYLKSVN